MEAKVGIEQEHRVFSKSTTPLPHVCDESGHRADPFQIDFNLLIVNEVIRVLPPVLH